MSIRQIILQTLLLIKILVVAKILGPTIYGTFGLLLIVVMLSDQFTQLGFELELIHKPDSRYQYNTVWSLKVLRGILLFITIQVFRNPILNLVGSEANFWVLTVISSILVIEGFVNIGTIEFPKELNYRLEFIFRAIPDILNIVFTIFFLFIMQDIWALIYGLLAERVSRLLLSYLLHSFRPRLEFDRKVISELFEYGKWILLMGILAYFRLQGPDLFIGAILGASFVAIYQLSFKLVSTPATAMSDLVGSVSIPTYAKLQGNPESSIKTLYITLLGQFLVFNVYFSLFWPIIPIFVKQLLGSSWKDMIVIMQILFFIGYLIVIIVSIEPIFVANGIQKKLVQWQILILSIFLVSVYSVTLKYGLIGITLLNLFSVFLLMMCYFFELSKIINIPYKELFSDVLHITTNGLVTIITLLYIIQYLRLHPILVICILIILGMIIYLSTTYVTTRFRKLLILHELIYLARQLFSSQN